MSTVSRSEIMQIRELVENTLREVDEVMMELRKKMRGMEAVLRLIADRVAYIRRLLRELVRPFELVAEVVSRNVSRGESAPLWKDPTLWACVFSSEPAPAPVEAPRVCPISLRVAVSHRTGWPAW